MREIVLFFGCRNENGDYLYREEWERRAKSGPLRIFTAFSRDDPMNKRYVTHCIRDADEFIWDLIKNQNAQVFVSGAAAKMPEDVYRAFTDVVKSQGTFSEENAKQWMKKLERDGRYHVESWS